MIVSWYCITYNRPELVEEMIESYLRQDYKGEKELIILNDCSEQELVFENPEVFILNCKRRFRTVGEKRNAAIAMCKGDVIFPSDDDDISLPHRTSFCLKEKGTHKYFKNKSAWLWQNGVIQPEPKYNVYPSMACWDRAFFEQVGGYAFLQSGQDIELDNRFRKTGERYVKEIREEEIYYIYKFGGTGYPHLSSYGYGKGWQEIGKREVVKTGIIKLEPKWRQDYEGMVMRILQSRSTTHASTIK